MTIKPTLTRDERRQIAEIKIDYEMGDINTETMTRCIDDVWNEARARVGLPPEFTVLEDDRHPDERAG